MGKNPISSGPHKRESNTDGLTVSICPRLCKEDSQSRTARFDSLGRKGLVEDPLSTRDDFCNKSYHAFHTRQKCQISTVQNVQVKISTMQKVSGCYKDKVCKFQWENLLITKPQTKTQKKKSVIGLCTKWALPLRYVSGSGVISRSGRIFVFNCA